VFGVFPSRDAWRRPGLRLGDLLVFAGLLALLFGLLRVGFFLDLLRRGFSADEARHQLDIAIDWGRYGEVFEYDAESGELILGLDRARVGG
jgi:hypothetical protein